MRNHLLLVVLICCVLCACNKPVKVVKVPLDPGLKAAFNFLPGTYWIYKDSATGIVDSFFVTSEVDEYPQTTASSGTVKVGEYIQIFISEVNTSPLPLSKDTVIWQFNLTDKMLSAYYTEKKIIGGEISYVPLINFPFEHTLTAYGPLPTYSRATGTVYGLGNTIQINGETYEDLALVNWQAYIPANINGYIGAPYSYDDWFFISKGIGLVKMRINHPQDSLNRVWELQRYVTK